MIPLCAASDKDVTMDSQELVKRIRENPEMLELKDVIRFEDMSEFNEFIQALADNTSITLLKCHGNLSFGVSQEQWSQTIAAFGSLRCLRRLEFLKHQVPNVFSLNALSLALKNAHALRELIVDDGVVVYGGRGDVDSFDESLRTSRLIVFKWLARLRLRPDAQGPPSLDPILLALSQSSQLEMAHFTIDSRTRNPVSPDSWRALARSRSIRTLSLQGDQAQEWSVLADVLIEPTCTLEKLSLKCYQADPEDCLALLQSMELNTSLLSLSLQVNRGFTDEVGFALAQVLHSNRVLNHVELLSGWTVNATQQSHLSGPAYQALIDVLQVNHSVVIHVSSPSNLPEDVDALAREFHMQSFMNQAGRWRLYKDVSQKSEWIDAFATLNELTMDGEASEVETHDTLNSMLHLSRPECSLSCIYRLLVDNPMLCQ
jgi:hypothetical protein